MSHPDGLDDALDARAEIRRLKKREKAAMAELSAARTERREAEQRFETVMSEIEHKQGRLFDPDEDDKPKGRGRKRERAEQLAG